VAAVGVALVSFMVPMVVVIVLLAKSFAGGGFGFIHIGDARSAEVWHGSLYYLSLLGRRARPIYRSALGSDDAVRVAATESDYPWLLATDSELWVIARDRVESWNGTKLDTVATGVGGYLLSRPFAFRGKPATLGVEPGRLVIYTFGGSSWDPAAELPCRCGYLPKTAFRVAANGDTLDLVVLDGSDVRHRRAKPSEDVGDPTTWSRVASGASRIEVASLGGGAFVVAAAHASTTRTTEIELWRADSAAAFASAGSERLQTPLSSWGLCADPASGSAFLSAMGGVNGDLNVVRFDSSGTVTRAHPATGTSIWAIALWPNVISVCLGLVLAFSLAGLLSRWGRELRGDEYAHEDRVVELASLSRRGVAQLIDTMIRTLPFIVAVVLFVSGALKLSTLTTPPYGPLWMMGFAFVSLGWSALEITLMSVAEWKSGKTPGKWLVGIRTVGTNLEPIGFGRAFIRNLAELADAMFMFTVGLAVAALTKNRQRLGDLAAQSIVIRER